MMRHGSAAGLGASLLLFMFATARADCAALHQAVQNNDVQRIDSELSWGTSIDCLHTTGSTPLHTAVYAVNPAMVQLLLNRGANVNARDTTGWTPLSVAYEGYYMYSTKDEEPAFEEIMTILEKAGGVDQ
jgi:hypothetical protein